MSCVVVCSLKHTGAVSIARSRIRISEVLLRTGPEHRINVCRMCDEPKCAKVCETDAIVPKDGILVILESRCVRCHDCVKACPYGAIFIDPITRYPIKCDLCGGDPLCVKVCPTGALRYET